MPRKQIITDDIFTVAEFLSPAECDAYIALTEGLGFADAPINTPYGPQLVSSVRNNTRLLVDDPVRAWDLWVRAEPFVPAVLDNRKAVGVNERLRFYRYEAGQRFDWHRDGAFLRADGEKSRLTFMVYLNDGFEGGRTKFEDCAVQPVKGTALFFVHRLLHTGEMVLAGRKYVLRTDVMYSAG